MKCARCGRDAVHFQRYSGLRLCGEHLVASLEARAKRMIRNRGWIQPGDRIAVGLSGSPSSCSLLRFLSEHFGMRRDLSLLALTAYEGPGSGMDMPRIRGIAEGMGVEWAGGEIPVDGPPGVAGEPSSRPSRPREQVLAALAAEAGATKLALGTSLDDEAGAVFLRVIRGEAAWLTAPAATGGGDIMHQGGPCPPGRSGIPVIRPFSRIPGEELLLYARLTGTGFIVAEKRPAPPSPESEAGRMLAEYTSRHPSTLFALAGIGEALADRGIPHG